MARFAFSAFADEAGVSLMEQIEAMKANDIRYFEPRNIDLINTINLGEEKLIEVKKLLDENGIKVGSLGSPIGKYPIYDDFETHLEDFKKALEACKILGTNKMRMFSFFVEEKDMDEKRDEIIERLKVMVEMAKEYGVHLCHENEARIYGEMPPRVKDLLDSVPDLYAVFDPAGEGEGKIGEILDIVNEQVDGLVYLTLEPHLKLFDAYKKIDDRELKGKYEFKNNRESFDFAVKALEKVMKDHGYRKDGNAEWIK